MYKFKKMRTRTVFCQLYLISYILSSRIINISMRNKCIFAMPLEAALSFFITSHFLSVYLSFFPSSGVNIFFLFLSVIVYQIQVCMDVIKFTRVLTPKEWFGWNNNCQCLIISCSLKHACLSYSYIRSKDIFLFLF